MTKKKSKRFPAPEEIIAEGGCTFPCASVMELCEAGLRNHELLIEHTWVEDEEDEEGDIMVWPSFRFSIRRVGTKDWNLIGLSEQGLNFAKCAGAGLALIQWFGALEDELGDTVAEMTFPEELNGEDQDSDS